MDTSRYAEFRFAAVTCVLVALVNILAHADDPLDWLNGGLYVVWSIRLVALAISDRVERQRAERASRDRFGAS